MEAYMYVTCGHSAAELVGGVGYYQQRCFIYRALHGSSARCSWRHVALEPIFVAYMWVGWAALRMSFAPPVAGHAGDAASDRVAVSCKSVKWPLHAGAATNYSMSDRRARVPPCRQHVPTKTAVEYWSAMHMLNEKDRVRHE
eukprot:TRINITY_DN1429_c0_g1_i2.p1 TRINITY_DN1429_c0_g1~~TRINITY_DN1429_c0_g1_i2.p1  ORF type:complete len:142 (-),score=5.28 TRINITY_DN1429_c0_g1_i2:164-589(-)